MKNFLANIVVLAVLSFVAVGCASVETNRTGAALTLECTQELEPTVKIADQAVQGEATVNSLFGVISWGVDKTATGVDFGAGSQSILPFGSAAEIARQGAVYTACINNNADFLAAPRYIITTKDYVVFKSITCKVIGFPGQLIKVTPAE